MSASFLKSSLSSMTRTRIMSPVASPGSVEREGVPRDAVPHDAVPSEVVPGDAVPHDAVPRERLPIDAAERRILPVERRAIEDREQRAGEAVRGPERAIGAGQGRPGLERPSQEPTTQEPTTQEPRYGRASRRSPKRRGHGGVCIEQPAAVRCWIGENLAALLPERLRCPDKERLDLIRGD